MDGWGLVGNGIRDGSDFHFGRIARGKRKRRGGERGEDEGRKTVRGDSGVGG